MEKNIGKLIIGVVFCLTAGLIASLATRSSILTWYPSLQKPSFTPPDWLFAPVWILLYIMMGISVSLVWMRGWRKQSVRTAMILFVIQLFFNAMWSIAFFGLRSPLLGLIDITILFVSLSITIFYFFRLSSWAASLLIPYLLWVSFAAILNYTIFILN